MNQSKKRLTAEEIARAKEKAQKRRDKKKQAGVRAKEESISTSLGTTSKNGPKIAPTYDTKREDLILNDKTGGESGSNEWTEYLATHGKWLTSSCDVKELNVGWPWVGAPPELLTQAPYAVNEYNFDAGFFTIPQEVQTSPLFNIHRGMEAPILQILFEHHSCASKFAATCQSAFNMVASNIDHWDFSRGGFNDCDKDAKGRTDSPGSVNKIVVVSPFRVRRWRGENFKCSMYSIQNMTHAFVNFAERFEILHLHRIPFLTTHLLGMVVPLMTKLKVLGVYRCELIHIGDTLKLLEIIRRDRSYGNGKTRKVKLDFYPRFHVGPVDNPVPYGKGSYGVTWDNFGLDSRLAIWQLLTRILPQAKKQGVDLISKDAAFRLWLEQSPCWRVADTIMAIERGDDGVKLAVQIDYPNTRGRAGQLNKKDHWAVEKYHCRDCKQHMLGIFFDFDEFTNYAWFSNQTYKMLCLGCKLNMHLGFEDDHRKLQKHHMVKGWLGDPEVNNKEADLEKALTNESKKMGMKYAARYDRDRKEYEAKNPGPWKQKHLVTNRTYSPSINDRERYSFW